MPTPAEGLTPASDDDAYRSAVSECISQMTGEGRDSAQAQAICYKQAETAAGRPYPKAGGGAGSPAAKRPRGRRITGAGMVEF